MYTTIQVVDDRPDRLHVRLHRPAVRNAIDRAMVDELHDVCAGLEAEPRILIFSGGDGVFASGADIAELRSRTAAERPAVDRRDDRHRQRRDAREDT